MEEYGVEVITRRKGNTVVYVSYNRDTNKITINALLDDTSRFKVLAHEVGHALLHKIRKEEVDPTQSEIEADVMSIFLSKYFGLESDGIILSHLKSHAKDIPLDKFTTYVFNAQSCFSEFVRYIDTVFEQDQHFEMEV